jgi:glucose/arabinose dehydrogenase
MFPAEWRGDALVAFHGSWNRTTPTGAKVVRVRVQNGRPVSYEDFISGWQGANGRRWGRPADVMVYKDGSLLISDDAAGAIYRVTRAAR